MSLGCMDLMPKLKSITQEAQVQEPGTTFKVFSITVTFNQELSNILIQAKMDSSWLLKVLLQ